MDIQNIITQEDIIKSLQTIALAQRDSIISCIKRLEKIDNEKDDISFNRERIFIVIAQLKDLL